MNDLISSIYVAFHDQNTKCISLHQKNIQLHKAAWVNHICYGMSSMCYINHVVIKNFVIPCSTYTVYILLELPRRKIVH